MNLVFLGPPGSGKGTQSATVIRALGIPQISTGDTIRAAIRGETELGRQAKAHAESGRLVPDELINRMVEARLAEPDCANGFLLDGYPRTVAQAEALDRMLPTHGLDHVLLLDVANETLLERVTGRRSDPDTGRVYHVVFDPPPAEIAERLIQRKDDRREVFEQRLVEYRDKTAPLIPFYEEKGLLRRIDGVGDRDEIGKRILAVLGH